MSLSPEQIRDSLRPKVEEPAQIPEQRVSQPEPSSDAFNGAAARAPEPRVVVPLPLPRQERPAKPLASANGQADLPHNPEIEQGILGCIIQSPITSLSVIQTRGIHAGYFYFEHHQITFDALLDFYEEVGATGPLQSLDLVLLEQRLKEMGHLERVGGPLFLRGLFSVAGSAPILSYYLDILIDRFLRRELIRTSLETVQQAKDVQQDVAPLIELAHSKTERLSAFTLPRKSVLSVRTVNELVEMTFDEGDNYFGDRVLAAGQACTMLGPGGIGKSRLSMQLAVCMITGRSFLDMETHAGDKRWLFVQTENNNRRLHYDLKNLMAALELTPAEIERVNAHLFIHTLENDLDALLNLGTPENYAAINSLIQDSKPNFIQWDPLNAFSDADLNSDMDMRALVSMISRLTRLGDPNRVALVLHHSLTGKAGASRAVGWDKASYGRNSKVLQAWTRAQINLAPRTADDPNLLVMSCGKNNNGKAFPEIGVLFQERQGVYVKDDSFDPAEFREEVGIATGSGKRKVVSPEDVALMCEVNTTKPKLVKRIRDEFGLQQRAAYDAINRTEEAGLIKRDRGSTWNSSYSPITKSSKNDNN